MPDQGRSLVSVAIVWLALGFSIPASAQDRYPRFSPERKSAVVKPTPMQDDANLHDVQFVSPDVGWAVGDRGVIWKTEDAGRTWRLQKSPVDGSLQKVCFLTDRVGWIVGEGMTAYTRIGYGVVLFTDDGGKRWRELVGRSKVERSKVGWFDSSTFDSSTSTQ